MPEGEPAISGIVPAAPRWRGLALFAAGVVTWLLSFGALARFGTWLPFALAGAALTAVALLTRIVPARLLVPSFATVGAGLGVGLVMVVLTHLAYAGVAPLVPGARAAAAALVNLLNVGGFPPVARAALVVVIATCEEVLFRGPLPLETTARRRSRGSLAAQVVASSAIYAAACVTLGSPLLLLVAFLCGLAWAALRVASRSLVAPIVAHVVWDLGVLVAWPPPVVP